MQFSFDGINKIIQINNGVVDITAQDCYSEWKEWVLIDDNSKFDQALKYVGGDPLPGSKKLGITYFIMNGWKIRPYSGNHTLNVDGNLYSEDGSSPYMSVVGSYNVMVINAVSSLVDSTVQQLPEIEQSSFNDVVTLDVNNGIAGTSYPIGTSLSPVNNLTDAKAIASVRGFSTINLLSDLVVQTGESIDELTIQSDNWLSVTIEPNVTSDNTEFKRVSLYGELGGFWNIVNDCWVYDITNFCGWLRGGSFVNIELAPYTIDSAGQSFFDNVLPMYPNIPATLKMNTDTSVSFTNSSDVYKITNMTSGSVLSMGIGRGVLIVDSTCIGGDVIVTGLGEVINESAITVDMSNLINTNLTTESNWSYTTSGNAFADINSVGYYLKNKVLSVSKFLGLK